MISLIEGIYNNPIKPHFPYLWNASDYMHSIELIMRFKGDEAQRVIAKSLTYSQKIRIIEI